MGMEVGKRRGGGFGEWGRLGEASGSMGEMKTKGKGIPEGKGESFLKGGELDGENRVVC